MSGELGEPSSSRVSPSWLSSKRFTAHLSWPDGRLPEKFLVLLLHKNMSSGEKFAVLSSIFAFPVVHAAPVSSGEVVPALLGGLC